MRVGQWLVGPALIAAVTTACTSVPPTTAPASTAAPAGGDASPAVSGAHRPWAVEPPLGPVPEASPRPATSEEAVVGYLRATYTVTAADRRIRHRRHHPWLHPTAPQRTGGHWTTDPPAAGVTRRVEIVELDLHANANADGRAAWAVAYRLWDGPELHADRARHVTTRRHGGAWYVVAETLDLQPVPH